MGSIINFFINLKHFGGIESGPVALLFIFENTCEMSFEVTKLKSNFEFAVSKFKFIV